MTGISRGLASLKVSSFSAVIFSWNPPAPPVGVNGR